VEFMNILKSGREEKKVGGGMWLVVAQPPSNHFPFACLHYQDTILGHKPRTRIRGHDKESPDPLAYHRFANLTATYCHNNHSFYYHFSAFLSTHCSPLMLPCCMLFPPPPFFPPPSCAIFICQLLITRTIVGARISSI